MTADTRLPRIERDPDTDQAKFFHTCSPTHDREIEEEIGHQLPTQPQFPKGWAWGPDDSLTPSVHCLDCGTHGWWKGTTQGWVPA